MINDNSHYYSFYISILLFKNHDLLFFLDPPDPPTNLKIIDFDVDFVELEWKKPDNDGGAPISQYIIEKRDKYK